MSRSLRPLQLNAVSVHAFASANRAPWSGVLSQVDTPSARPPQGSNGHCILIPKATALRVLDSLEGMPINLNHVKERPIGLVSRAWIEGSDLKVSGVLWGKNMPEVVAAIRRDQGQLGMSFELENCAIADVNADVWTLEDFTFCGAAILPRSTAAYGALTSIAARAAHQGRPMEDLITTLTKLNASLTTTIALQKRQQRHAPPPERSSRAYFELDAQFQQDRGNLESTTTAHRIANEITARGLAIPPTIRTPLLGPGPDMSMTPIDPNELIPIGPGMWRRRKDFSVTVYTELNPPGNGGYVPDSRTADIHRAIQPGDMEASDAHAKQQGLTIVQRMALELQRSWKHV